MLFVPDLRTNLISIGKITDVTTGLKVSFYKNTTSVTDPNGNVKLVADRIGGLYYVYEFGESAHAVTCSTCNTQREDSFGNDVGSSPRESGAWNSCARTRTTRITRTGQ